MTKQTIAMYHIAPEKFATGKPTVKGTDCKSARAGILICLMETDFGILTSKNPNLCRDPVTEQTQIIKFIDGNNHDNKKMYFYYFNHNCFMYDNLSNKTFRIKSNNKK